MSAARSNAVERDRAAPEIGTVKFYHPEREFGFIIPDAGGGDVFIHARSLRMSGIDMLQAGDRVEFERVQDRHGWQAHRPRLLEDGRG